MGERAKQTPLEKGYSYLIHNCNARYCYQPVVSADPQFSEVVKTPFPEIFDTTLILDLLIDKPFCPITLEIAHNYISKHQKEDNLFTFFEDPTLLPADVDDTALAMLVLLKNRKRTEKEAHAVVDKIVTNCDEEGRIQTYFPPQNGRESRVDPSVCANALRLIHLLGRGSECKATEDFLFHYLEELSSLPSEKNLYYGNQTFFYFMGEALKVSPGLRKRFESLFIERMRSCIGSSMGAIDLATRVIVSNDWGVLNPMEVEKLSFLQKDDGSWPLDVAYTGSRKNLYWGSSMLSTAFALRALDHEKVQADQKERAAMPIFAQGFELKSGLLSYGKSFEPFHFDYETLAITHTETLSALSGKFYAPDPNATANALTAKGEQDAHELGRRLKAEVGEKPCLILHGDNTRTFQTASAICAQIPTASLQRAVWLSEIQCGEWLGSDSAHVLQTNFTAISMFHHSNCLAQPKDGENFLTFLNNIYLGLKELQKKNLPKNTIVLLCTSRVNLVALKILTQNEVIDHTYIDWSQMAKSTKPGTLFPLNK